MDPFTLATSLAGLLNLAIELTKITHGFARSVKRAPAEVQSFVEQLLALSDVLERLVRFLRGPTVSIHFDETCALCSTTKSCQHTLESALRKLVKVMDGGRLSRSIERLKWPLNRQENIDVVNTLHRCTQIFQFSLTVDGCTLLLETSRDVSAILKSQSSISDNVMEILQLVEPLLCLPTKLQDMGDGVRNLGLLSYDIRNDTRDFLENQSSDERQKALAWLTMVDPSVNHNIAVECREPDTGVWFLDSDDFKDWKSSTNSVLWLYGIPGCGKTILWCEDLRYHVWGNDPMLTQASSTIIEAMKDYCLASTGHKLAYFYFDFNDSSKQDVSVLLRSLVKQLCFGEPELPPEVQELGTQYRAFGQQPTTSELASALLSIVDGLGKQVYIIMDALDEYPERSEKSWRKSLLDRVRQMVEHKSENLHILVTSRNEQDIRETLTGLKTRQICVRSSQVDADIMRHVRTCLKKDAVLKRLPDDVKLHIESKLGERAHGIKVAAVKKALEELPETLDKTYERMLTNIARSDFDEARSILQWLAVSERPLTLREVAEAAILRPGDDHIDKDERLYDASDVLRICRGLISLSTEEVETSFVWTKCDVVRFAHFSVKEYLTSHIARDGPASAFFISDELAHSHVGECCVSYLLQMDQPTLQERDLDDNPLLRYAAENWFKHAKAAEGTVAQKRRLEDRIVRLFSSDSTHSYLNWLRVYDLERPYLSPEFERSTLHIPPPICFASMLGFQRVVKRLLEGGFDVNAKGGYYGNALAQASRRGHLQIVRFLLENGADVNSKGGYFGNALSAASRNGHIKTVKLLLSHGADINAQGGEPGNALASASRGGYIEIVALLLSHGADPNAQYRSCCTALQAAARGANAEIVRLLLDSGADANAREGPYGTAIQAASYCGDVETATLLLGAGADPLRQGGAFGSALETADARGNMAVAQLLRSAVGTQ